MPVDGWPVVVKSWMPQELTIGAGEIHEEIHTAPAGCRVKYQWALIGHTILFEVSLRPLSSSHFKLVSPKQNYVFSDLEDPVLGEVCAPAGGCEIKLVWDNTNSRL